MTLCCSGCCYCTNSFNKVCTQVLQGFKSCSGRAGDLRWWEYLSMVPAENKIKRIWLLNLSAKTLHHKHQVHFNWDTIIVSHYFLSITRKKSKNSDFQSQKSKVSLVFRCLTAWAKYTAIKQKLGNGSL